MLPRFLYYGFARFLPELIVLFSGTCPASSAGSSVSNCSERMSHVVSLICKDFELIVVNGTSTEGSLAVIQ